MQKKSPEKKKQKKEKKTSDWKKNMPKKAIWKSKKNKKKTKKITNKQVKTQESNEVTMERGLHTQLDPTFPEGGPTPSLTLPRDLGWGVQPPGWPYPGPGWGDPGRRRGQKSLFFLLFPRKKAKKKQKKAIWAPKFPATFTTFPDGAAKSAKFPPNLAKVHVPRRLVTIRGILFHLQAPKVGWHSQRKRLQVFFVVFFQLLVFCFFFCFFLLFYCLFVCFFFCFFVCFFLLFFFNRFFFAFFKMAKSLFFAFFLMRFTELAWTVHHNHRFTIGLP